MHARGAHEWGDGLRCAANKRVKNDHERGSVHAHNHVRRAGLASTTTIVIPHECEDKWSVLEKRADRYLAFLGVERPSWPRELA